MEEASQCSSSTNPTVIYSALHNVPNTTSKAKRPSYLKSASIKILTHPIDKNITWSFIVSVIFAAVAIVTGLPSVIFLTIFLIWALIVRKLGLKCCFSRHRPRLDSELNLDKEMADEERGRFCCSAVKMVKPSDAFWLYDSSFSVHVAHCLFYLDKGLSVFQIRELIRVRVIERPAEDGNRHTAFPRLTSRLVPMCCGYAWTEDKNFAIENHVYDEPSTVITLCDLESLVTTLISQPLTSDKPLWELRVISNYGKNEDTVLLLRIHHAVSDAMSLVRILGNCLSDNEKYTRVKSRFGPNTYFLNFMRTIIVGPMTFLGWLFCTRRDYNFLNRRHKPDGRVVAWSKQIRFSRVNRIKQVMRCTLNDVLVSMVSGAIRSYFKKNGIRNPPNMTLSLPVDLRFDLEESETPELGARYACVNVRLPCNTEGAIPRLWAVRHNMEELKTSPDPVVMYGAIHYLLPIFPECIAQWMLNNVCKKATVLLSNVPGPDELLTLGSKRLKRIIFWMAARAEVPVAFSVISYDGNIQLTVSADKAVIPRPQDLLQEITVELRILSHLLARRRIPGEHRRKSNFTVERRQEEIIKPPIQELQQKLYQVQDEIHTLTARLCAIHNAYQDNDSCCGSNSASEAAIFRNLEELKEEYSELITELRRRKSLVDGIIIDIEADDMDGELRKGRKRALSNVARRSSFTSLLSSSSTDTTLHQAFVVSTPNLKAAGSPTSSQQKKSFLGIVEERIGRRKSDFN